MRWTKDGSWWRSACGRFTLMPHQWKRGEWVVMCGGGWVQGSTSLGAAKRAAERHARKPGRQSRPVIDVQ